MIHERYKLDQCVIGIGLDIADQLVACQFAADMNDMINAERILLDAF